jgi:starch phosphorylase
VLAGDHCKEAGDLGVPLVGVGFMYPQGYFHQHCRRRAGRKRATSASTGPTRRSSAR